MATGRPERASFAMPAKDASDRVLIARVAAHESWAKTDDRSARTAPARQGLHAWFERQVDPDGTLDPRELAIRVQHARKAHYTRMALKSARSRRRGSALLAEADAADAELSQLDGGDAA